MQSWFQMWSWRGRVAWFSRQLMADISHVLQSLIKTFARGLQVKTVRHNTRVFPTSLCTMQKIGLFLWYHWWPRTLQEEGLQEVSLRFFHMFSSTFISLGQPTRDGHGGFDFFPPFVMNAPQGTFIEVLLFSPHLWWSTKVWSWKGRVSCPSLLYLCSSNTM